MYHMDTTTLCWLIAHLTAPGLFLVPQTAPLGSGTHLPLLGVFAFLGMLVRSSAWHFPLMRPLSLRTGQSEAGKDNAVLILLYSPPHEYRYSLRLFSNSARAICD